MFYTRPVHCSTWNIFKLFGILEEIVSRETVALPPF